MECLCKACGNTLSTDAKERRPLKDRPYSILFELAAATRIDAAAIHSVLASAPSYVCRPCHSTLTKYETIKEQVNIIKIFMTSAFTTEHRSVPVSHEIGHDYE